MWGHRRYVNQAFDSAGALISYFIVSRTVRNKFLLFMKHSIYRVLLKQPERADGTLQIIGWELICKHLRKLPRPGMTTGKINPPSSHRVRNRRGTPGQGRKTSSSREHQGACGSTEPQRCWLLWANPKMAKRKSQKDQIFPGMYVPEQSPLNTDKNTKRNNKTIKTKS